MLFFCDVHIIACMCCVLFGCCFDSHTLSCFMSIIQTCSFSILSARTNLRTFRPQSYNISFVLYSEQATPWMVSLFTLKLRSPVLYPQSVELDISRLSEPSIELKKLLEGHLVDNRLTTRLIC